MVLGRAACVLILLYNLLALAVDAWALAALRWRDDEDATSGAALLRAGARAAVGHAVLPWLGFVVYSYHSFFGVLGLLAWSVFLHGFILLAGAAWLLRRESPRTAAVCAFLAVGLEAVAYDAFLVEPFRLQVTHHQLTSPKLSAPVRIVVLADIQTERVGEHERAAIRAALAAEPDLILMPGDYVQATSSAQWEEVAAELRPLLAELAAAAQLGVYAVRGNVEPPWWPRMFAGLDVVTFDQTGSAGLGEILLTGLSFQDSYATAPPLPTRPMREQPEAFTIVMGHSPNFALGSFDADLLVAGHTHGGQVRLPLIGPPIILSRVPRSWASGRTDLGDGRVLIVSNGIGVERGHAPRLRLLCPPQVVVIDLVPAEGEHGLPDGDEGPSAPSER